MSPVPRTSRRRAAIVTFIAALVLALPVGVLAGHQFGDVPDGNPYHNDVDALVDAGVTSGCGGGNYCPNRSVTRGEMAAFMNRLGALGPGKTPVVNAATSNSTDGWSLGCPGSTALSGGLCFETGTRPALNVFDASETCGALGGGIFGFGQVWTLPGVLELRAADEGGDIAITAEEWSSTYYFDDANGAQAASVVGNGGTVDHNTLDLLPYRCASIPSRFDGIIFIPFGEEQDGTDAGPSTNGGDTVSDDGSSD